MSAYRTFKVQSPKMKGSDIESWEHELKDLFKGIGIHAPIISDGTYGAIDRSYTKSFMFAIGKDPDRLEHGLTPQIRSEIRKWKENQTEHEVNAMGARLEWRRRLRDRYRKLDSEDQGQVSLFLTKLLADSWGYHPGVHDGIDLISLPDVPIFAPFKSKVIDVRSEGWWGKGAPADAALRARGDGIVQLEILEDIGPVKKGWHIGLGHAEKARVKVDDIVEAGTWVANTGFANAWHIHAMLNNGLTTKGIGNLDPRAMVDYTIEHANK